ALWATWLVVLTPSILAQATSTNDEILTATSLLVSLYCGWRWLVTGERRAFFLAAVAIGLSVGTKLHIVFLTPILLAALVVALWQLCKKPGLPRLWGRAIGWRTGLISLALTVVLMGSFLVYNYLSCGRFYFVDDFAKDVFNLRASLYGAFQNLLIYLSQMVLSPIADLNFWPVANDRQNFNNLLNQLFNPLIGAFIDENPSFYHMGYRFVGITLPVSVRFVEFSLWSGFIWLLWPWQARLALKQPFPLRPLFFLLAVTPPVWLLLWSFSTLYMEGTATYFTYSLVCAAPAAIFSFAPVRRALWNDLRWVAIAVVTLTSFVISTNLLMYSGFRALPDLVYARVWPYDWDLIEPNIIHEIRRADKIRIVMTHEKMPYFAFMHWHPTAQYANPFSMDMTPSEAGKFLQILPISSMVEFGFMPLKIPGKTNPGLTYLGAIRGIGREAIFALGNDVHRRWPDQSDYIVPHVTIVPTEGGRIVALDKNVPGLKDEDNLEFSYVLKQGDNVLYQRDWQREPSFSVRVLGNVELNNPLYLTLIVRSAWSNKELTRATYQVTGRGAWLPDGTEY
ncbi:MAG: phospholipid carrier-dependent glycosyltransferase, partial [Alphaproteobacteria bacterium]|nr:phospholipid carrier-dependent glycosyltransferase [Alphaproteobacteria bacterium]